MSELVEISSYSDTDLKNVYDQYRRKLKKNMLEIPFKNELKQTLVEDPLLKLSPEDFKYKAVVLDVGGSFFKIAVVEFLKLDKEIECKVESVKEFPYPIFDTEIEHKNTGKTFWYDWVAEIYVNYVIENNIRANFCSLIFSYPIKYENNIAKPVALAKHWCFEYEKTLNSDLQSNLNNAIKKLFKISETQINIKNYLIQSVLNDSVATFFSSKVLSKNTAIGIILGTGTNGAFDIECEGKKYVLNNEWGSFAPKNIDLLPEEKEYIDNLQVNYNLLDVLVGNGYKCGILNQIIKSRQLPVDKINTNCVGEIMRASDGDIKKMIVKGLIKRSRQIMSMMVCASAANIGCKNATILLNGSGYSDPVEREAFLNMIQEYAKEVCQLDVEFNLCYKEGLTFIGAAYYGFVKYSTNK